MGWLTFSYHIIDSPHSSSPRVMGSISFVCPVFSLPFLLVRVTQATVFPQL